MSLSCAGDAPGSFGEGTEAAVRLFQHYRKLRIDGVCGIQTWSALVEASYRLGERPLYRKTPMLRGDDVAELQRRLGELGFDAGRVDGIFGDNTAEAVADFQRNAGLTVDGIFGRTTQDALARLQPKGETQPVVAAIRERELLRGAPRTLNRRKVALGSEGGLDEAVLALARSLRVARAEVLKLDHRDGSQRAAEANQSGAAVYVGIALSATTRGCSTSYYSGYRYESEGGRRLAELVQAILPGVLGMEDHGIQGLSVPILRETRMPAVVCEMGPRESVLAQLSTLSVTLCDVLSKWSDESWE